MSEVATQQPAETYNGQWGSLEELEAKRVEFWERVRRNREEELARRMADAVKLKIAFDSEDTVPSWLAISAEQSRQDAEAAARAAQEASEERQSAEEAGALDAEPSVSE